VKILNSIQIREWDQYTILNEPIASLDLMERAAFACTDWLLKNGYINKSFSIFCGKGNNGGDGMAMARMLASYGNQVAVYIISPVEDMMQKGTPEFQINLERLRQATSVNISLIQNEEQFQQFQKGEIIIDALYGSGINRPLAALALQIVNNINISGCEVISIDIPSGLYVDHSSLGNATIHATHTLSFQCYKPAFIVAENAFSIGEVHLLDIGLHKDYYQSLTDLPELIDRKKILNLYLPRNRFAHKGNFGHSLIMAGSNGKMGAAVLAAKACLRSGSGLVSCFIPKSGYDILQNSAPEAMVLTELHFKSDTKNDLERFSSIGIGPGLGITNETIDLLFQTLKNFSRPMVFDADALNIIAGNKQLFDMLPLHSILTPHPKEFERLFGPCQNEFERINKATAKAIELKCFIVLKGHHTLITTPLGQQYFNSSGNAGMAKGGSGDVLCGIISGLLAQGYSPENASIIGVYIHGLAGDIAAQEFSQEAMLATDIINSLPQAYLRIFNSENA